MGGRGGGDRRTEPLLEKLSESSHSSSEDHPVKRTGTVWTASAHIITAVVGSGVLSLAWSVAQLGWVGGPAAMVFFAGVTVVQSSLLAECYISRGDPERGGVVRNRSYMDAVRLHLGEKKRMFSGFFLSISLFGSGVVYTLTAATSMRAIHGANRYHRERYGAPFSTAAAAGESSDVYYMLLFGLAQAVLSQIPDFHNMAWLSVFAAGRHVLLLLLRRLRPRRRQSDRKWSDQGGNRRHSPGIPDAEGVARRTVPRGHRLRLPVHLGAAGNRGHAEVAAGGERDDEEGVEGQHRGHHLLLPRLRVLRLRGVRRWHAGEPPHRLRRALLAHRPRQPLRRPPPSGRLPAVQPAGVRARGAAVRRGGLGRRGGAAAARPAAPCERVQAVLPHDVRGGGDGGGRVVPLLQPGGRAHRRLHLLAAGHPLPHRDVPRAGQGGAVDDAVARHPGLQRHMPARRRLRLRWVRRGGVRPRQKLS